MNNNVKLLDCTLRDGGYVNDWRFGNGPITSIFNRLNDSGTDIIEIGFLDDRQPFDVDRTIQPDSKSLDEVFKNTLPKKSMIVAMIDYGTCSLDNVLPCSETNIDGIRVIFKKEKMYKAVEYGKKIMEKGYKLFLQMVSITTYSDDDIEEFCRCANNVNPYAVSIVDTYGLMHKEEALHYFDLLDKYLNQKIMIGYHSHNNLQLAYSNTIEFVNHNTRREIVIDGTLYGMGKNAGNAPIELLANYLNERYEKDYNINQLMEAIYNDIIDIQKKNPWGYNLIFYLASKNTCHPNYVKYLVSKDTLSMKSVDDLLGRIDSDNKLKYDKSYIEKLYRNYISETVDDLGSRGSLETLFTDKDLLIIGPGRSIKDNSSIVEQYRLKHSPVTIAVNFIPSDIKIDYVFINNSKRYSLMAPHINSCDVKVIATSKITPVGKLFDYVVEYEKLIQDRNELFDNALSLFLNLLEEINIRSITLAGFDGFSKDMTKNYVDGSYERVDSFEYFSKINTLMKEKIRDYSRKVPIKFITKSTYW